MVLTEDESLKGYIIFYESVTVSGSNEGGTGDSREDISVRLFNLNW